MASRNGNSTFRSRDGTRWTFLYEEILNLEEIYRVPSLAERFSERPTEGICGEFYVKEETCFEEADPMFVEDIVNEIVLVNGIYHWYRTLSRSSYTRRIFKKYRKRTVYGRVDTPTPVASRTTPSRNERNGAPVEQRNRFSRSPENTILTVEHGPRARNVNETVNDTQHASDSVTKRYITEIRLPSKNEMQENKLPSTVDNRDDNTFDANYKPVMRSTTKLPDVYSRHQMNYQKTGEQGSGVAELSQYRLPNEDNLNKGRANGRQDKSTVVQNRNGVTALKTEYPSLPKTQPAGDLLKERASTEEPRQRSVIDVSTRPLSESSKPHGDRTQHDLSYPHIIKMFGTGHNVESSSAANGQFTNKFSGDVGLQSAKRVSVDKSISAVNNDTSLKASTTEDIHDEPQTLTNFRYSMPCEHSSLSLEDDQTFEQPKSLGDAKTDMKKQDGIREALDSVIDWHLQMSEDLDRPSHEQITEAKSKPLLDRKLTQIIDWHISDHLQTSEPDLPGVTAEVENDRTLLCCEMTAPEVSTPPSCELIVPEEFVNTAVRVDAAERDDGDVKERVKHHAIEKPHVPSASIPMEDMYWQHKSDRQYDSGDDVRLATEAKFRDGSLADDNEMVVVVDVAQKGLQEIVDWHFDKQIHSILRNISDDFTNGAVDAAESAIDEVGKAQHPITEACDVESAPISAGSEHLGGLGMNLGSLELVDSQDEHRDGTLVDNMAGVELTRDTEPHDIIALPYYDEMDVVSDQKQLKGIIEWHFRQPIDLKSTQINADDDTNAVMEVIEYIASVVYSCKDHETLDSKATSESDVDVQYLDAAVVEQAIHAQNRDAGVVEGGDVPHVDIYSCLLELVDQLKGEESGISLTSRSASAEQASVTEIAEVDGGSDDDQVDVVPDQMGLRDVVNWHLQHQLDLKSIGAAEDKDVPEEHILHVVSLDIAQATPIEQPPLLQHDLHNHRMVDDVICDDPIHVEDRVPEFSNGQPEDIPCCKIDVPLSAAGLNSADKVDAHKSFSEQTKVFDPIESVFSNVRAMERLLPCGQSRQSMSPFNPPLVSDASLPPTKPQLATEAQEEICQPIDDSVREVETREPDEEIASPLYRAAHLYALVRPRVQQNCVNFLTLLHKNLAIERSESDDEMELSSDDTAYVNCANGLPNLDIVVDVPSVAIAARHYRSVEHNLAAVIASPAAQKVQADDAIEAVDMAKVQLLDFKATTSEDKESGICRIILDVTQKFTCKKGVSSANKSDGRNGAGEREANDSRKADAATPIENVIPSCFFEIAGLTEAIPVVLGTGGVAQILLEFRAKVAIREGTQGLANPAKDDASLDALPVQDVVPDEENDAGVQAIDESSDTPSPAPQASDETTSESNETERIQETTKAVDGLTEDVEPEPATNVPYPGISSILQTFGDLVRKRRATTLSEEDRESPAGSDGPAPPYGTSPTPNVATGKPEAVRRRKHKKSTGIDAAWKNAPTIDEQRKNRCAGITSILNDLKQKFTSKRLEEERGDGKTTEVAQHAVVPAKVESKVNDRDNREASSGMGRYFDTHTEQTHYLDTMMCTELPAALRDLKSEEQREHSRSSVGEYFKDARDMDGYKGDKDRHEMASDLLSANVPGHLNSAHLGDAPKSRASSDLDMDMPPLYDRFFTTGGPANEGLPASPPVQSPTPDRSEEQKLLKASMAFDDLIKDTALLTEEVASGTTTLQLGPTLSCPSKSPSPPVMLTNIMSTSLSNLKHIENQARLSEANARLLQESCADEIAQSSQPESPTLAAKSFKSRLPVPMEQSPDKQTQLARQRLTSENKRAKDGPKLRAKEGPKQRAEEAPKCAKEGPKQRAKEGQKPRAKETPKPHVSEAPKPHVNEIPKPRVDEIQKPPQFNSIDTLRYRRDDLNKRLDRDEHQLSRIKDDLTQHFISALDAGYVPKLAMCALPEDREGYVAPAVKPEIKPKKHTGAFYQPHQYEQRLKESLRKLRLAQPEFVRRYYNWTDREDDEVEASDACLARTTDRTCSESTNAVAGDTVFDTLVCRLQKEEPASTTSSNSQETSSSNESLACTRKRL